MHGLSGGSGNLKSPCSLHAWMSLPNEPPMPHHHWGTERLLGKGYFPPSSGCRSPHQLLKLMALRGCNQGGTMGAE